jgi:hypothetical protein
VDIDALRKNIRKDLFAKNCKAGIENEWKIFGAVVLFLLAMGWANFEPAVAPAATEGKGIPAIVQSFALTQIRPGQVLGGLFESFRHRREDKIYLCHRYPNTSPARLPQFFNRSLTLTVNIQGRGGHFSQPAVFPLFFQANPTPEAPPEGVFKEQNLGPIMVTLRTGKRP